MKVLFITRSTLYTVFGGDTVQVESTAKYLRRTGVEVDIRLSNERMDYEHYDLLHFFNIIRPSDILAHITKTRKPFVISTIFVDYAEYEQHNKSGVYSTMTRLFSADQLEYIKAIARWIKNGERVQSVSYLRYGHAKAIQYVAKKAAMLLPNSYSEYARFKKHYHVDCPHQIIYNGIDPDVFPLKENTNDDQRNNKLIICVSRIEGRKNQLNLIKALNNTDYTLYLIGKPATNHISYYEKCKKNAAKNIHFLGFIQPKELIQYYQQAKVHVLPSWNETCGLSNMEAACNGCNIVITDKGDTKEYYENNAWYCDPAEPRSIFNAIDTAAKAPSNKALYEKIKTHYTWEKAAQNTLNAYRTVLHTEHKA